MDLHKKFIVTMSVPRVSVEQLAPRRRSKPTFLSASLAIGETVSETPSRCGVRTESHAADRFHVGRQIASGRADQCGELVEAARPAMLVTVA
jgi:hypothetical protein